MSEQKDVNIWELSDLCTPWCIRVVVTLQIAEHIESGIHEIGDLAAAASCDAYVLHRILTYLVEKGIFQEATSGHFALNDAARQLLHPMARLVLDLDGLGGRLSHAWGTLLTYARTGKPSYHEVFGLPFWEDLNSHPDIAAQFDDLMGQPGHGLPNPDFQVTGGWDSVHTVVDVGGGTGALLGEILRVQPHIRGTLVDQPRTVALSGEIFRAAGVTERVTTVEQSFFDPLPAGADLYLLKSILNDWPDAEATAILRRCAQAAHPYGRVIILGGVSLDDVPRPLVPEMVLVGGKSRTVTEIQALAKEAGLDVMSAGEQPSGHFVVECRPI